MCSTGGVLVTHISFGDATLELAQGPLSCVGMARHRGQLTLWGNWRIVVWMLILIGFHEHPAS